ncbi:MAG: hypothetical protein ACHWZW_21170 [Spirulina sp.]
MVRLTVLLGALIGIQGLNPSAALANPPVRPTPMANPSPAAQPKQTEPTDPQTAPTPPDRPPLPTTIPDAVVPPNTGIVGLIPGPEDNLGVGLLHPRDLSFLDTTAWESHPLAYGRWLRSVALPLYVGPDGDHWGWMVNGWLMINGYEPIAIGQDASFAMVEARQGIYSFPVLEQRSDGWFRFQYTPAGSAWANIAHLDDGAITLTLQPWEDILATAPQIRFRRHGLSQSLRTEPRETSPLQFLVAPNSYIRPLTIDGDWVQVEVTQPVQGCTPLPGHTSETGWLRWRNGDQALLVWTVSSGCPDPDSPDPDFPDPDSPDPAS